MPENSSHHLSKALDRAGCRVLVTGAVSGIGRVTTHVLVEDRASFAYATARAIPMKLPG